MNSIPSCSLHQAFFQANDVPGQTKIIWANTNEHWNPNTEYEFSLKHRPRTGIINFQIKEGGSNIVDSGDIQVDVSSGGRVGVFAYGQDDCFWSDLFYSCQGNVTSGPSSLYIHKGLTAQLI